MKLIKLSLGLFLSFWSMSNADAQNSTINSNVLQGKKAIFATLDSSIQEGFINGVKMNTLKEVYLYTSSGFLYRKEKYQWSMFDTAWKLSTFFSYSYNSNGLPVIEAELGPVQVGWDTLQKRYFMYDTTQLPIEERVEKKSISTGQYFVYSKHRSVYDSLGRLQEDSLLITNDEGNTYIGNWYQYFYHQNGQLDYKIAWSKTSNTWNKVFRFLYEYDTNNKLAVRHFYMYSPSTQSWNYNSRANYVIDSIGNIEELHSFQNTDSATYTPSQRMYADYDNSIPISQVTFPYYTGYDIPPLTLLNRFNFVRYNTNTSSWDSSAVLSFYYTKVNTSTSLVENLKLSLYPNPCYETVHIAVDQWGKYAYRIYSLQGGLVMESSFQGLNSEIDLHALPSGAYILELQNDQGVSRQKFIKQ